MIDKISSMSNYNEIEKIFNNNVERAIRSNIVLNNPSLSIQQKNEEINRIRVDEITKIRRKCISDLFSYTNRNIIVYYSTFLQGVINSNNPELMINDNDMNGFMNAICGLDKSKGLDLILQTPGGVTTATDAIVQYLRKIFGTNIRVIVPHLAMSGGTMIACASKRIVMGKQSSLGPIDPQYYGVPAEGAIAEFKQAMDEVLKDPRRISVWKEIISQYRPTFLMECKNSIDLSRNLVKEWLASGMFKNSKNKDAAIDLVLKGLSHEVSKQHGKHFDYNYCKNLKMKVDVLENDAKLQDLVLSIHHSYVLSAYVIPSSLKFIENQNGKGFIISGQK